MTRMFYLFALLATASAPRASTVVVHLPTGIVQTPAAPCEHGFCWGPDDIADPSQVIDLRDPRQ